VQRKSAFHGQFIGVCWLAVSIFTCVASLRLGIGTFQTPGPGFFLFWAGIGLGILAIVLRILDSSKKEGKGRTMDLWKELKWHKAVFVLISLFIYIILLPRIGYLIMTFGLLIFLFSVIERSRLWVQMVFALVTATATYIIFYLWLDVQLPRGIF
jgi:putative tricarboxylic transport membrane protein